MKKFIFFMAACHVYIAAHAQKTDSTHIANSRLDSIYISSVEEARGKPKVLHAEPLYIDLIRDLGARKGESEWNFGTGIKDNIGFDEIEMLVEYEFAPVDRIGLEVELPFTFYSKQRHTHIDSIPSSGLESIKLAGQWSFLVSEKLNTSLAIGYIHEFMLPAFTELKKDLYQGNVFNPFFIAAKRWGQNFHSLIYTGPRIEKPTRHYAEVFYDINSNIHYMIPGTRNFVGIEVNKTIHQQDFDMIIRPQMRLSITDNLLIGIVGGIPVKREEQRFSMFTRLIWEPSHKRRQ